MELPLDCPWLSDVEVLNRRIQRRLIWILAERVWLAANRP